MDNKRYSSKKVFKKATFNIGFQIFPILVALIIMPILINNLGKDFWAKYTTGISVIFLSNYFSFGIGPALNRRISELIGQKKYRKIGDEVNDCISLSFIFAISFFVVFLVILISAYATKAFSILQSPSDFIFFLLVEFCFFLVLLTIPYRSALEAFSDFYFLSILRALVSMSLFLVPLILWLFNAGNLVSSALVLLLFYVLIGLVYLFRLKRYKKKFGFSSVVFPLRNSSFNLLRRDNPFLKETLSFGLFFLCSALVLFFDRFYYPIFFETELLADHVTMLDLFNRIAIVTGTISLVYFSAISVWFNEDNLRKIRKNLRLQFVMVSALFLGVAVFGYFFISDLMAWWLKESFSQFIKSTSFAILIGVLFVNFEILMIRPLQAIGLANKVNKLLVVSTLIYLVIVLLLGFFKAIQYHYIALLVKGAIDLIVLSYMLKKERLI